MKGRHIKLSVADLYTRRFALRSGLGGRTRGYIALGRISVVALKIGKRRFVTHCVPGCLLRGYPDTLDERRTEPTLPGRFMAPDLPILLLLEASCAAVLNLAKLGDMYCMGG